MIPKFNRYEFIKETYTDNDLEFLKKIDLGNNRLSFTENLTRLETTDNTAREIDIINNKVKNNMYGKATKRIMKCIRKDPAYIRGESDFIISLAKKLKIKNE